MKTQVYRIVDGSANWLVRGTSDVAEATNLLLDDPEVYEYEDGIAEDCDLEPVITVNQAGLFRFNPCNCLEGHVWHLGFANAKRQGVFEGVLLDVRFEELEFDCD